MLSTPLMLRLGECSFALYLIQFLPIGSVKNIGMFTQRSLESLGLHFVAAAFVSYVIFNIIAYATYSVIERPLATYLRRYAE
jgi:peptidoglycan/LPS O-acetylase OafA/YrhL